MVAMVVTRRRKHLLSCGVRRVTNGAAVQTWRWPIKRRELRRTTRYHLQRSQSLRLNLISSIQVEGRSDTTVRRSYEMQPEVPGEEQHPSGGDAYEGTRERRRARKLQPGLVDDS